MRVLWLADMPHRELARRLSGGLTYSLKFKRVVKKYGGGYPRRMILLWKPLPDSFIYPRYLITGFITSPVSLAKQTDGVRNEYNPAGGYRCGIHAFADGGLLNGTTGDENVQLRYTPR